MTKKGAKELANQSKYNSASNLEAYNSYLGRIATGSMSVEKDSAAEAFEELGIDYEFAERNDIGFYADEVYIPASRFFYICSPEEFKGKSYSISMEVANEIAFPRVITEPDEVSFIVEGPLNMLMLDRFGCYSTSINTKDVNALFSIIDNNVEPLGPDKVFVISMDKDEEGIKATKNLLHGLAARGINALESLMSKKYGLNYYEASSQFGDEEIEAMLKKEEERARKLSGYMNLTRNEVLAEAQEDELAEYSDSSASAVLSSLTKRITSREKGNPTPTGFAAFDSVIGGGLNDELYILGAIPGIGKTTFVLQVADNIARSGGDVLFFSLEMKAEDLVAKSLSRISYNLLGSEPSKWGAFSYREICTGKKMLYGDFGLRFRDYTDSELELYNNTKEQYETIKDRLYFYEAFMGGNKTVTTASVREAVSKHIKLTGRKPVVIIDYLQKLQPSASTEISDKTNMDISSSELRAICCEFSVPIFAVSSLNRTGYVGNKGSSIYKESGGLEYTGDVLFKLGLADESEDTSMIDIETALHDNPRHLGIKVLKNRHGEVGDVITFDFFATFSCFVETGKRDYLDAVADKPAPVQGKASKRKTESKPKKK